MTSYRANTLKRKHVKVLRPDPGPSGFPVPLFRSLEDFSPDVNPVGFWTFHPYHSMAPLLTGQEVAKHNTRESCWIIVHGKRQH